MADRESQSVVVYVDEHDETTVYLAVVYDLRFCPTHSSNKKSG